MSVSPSSRLEKKKERGKRERTWRDLKPSEFYSPSKKLEQFYKCQEAGFTCLSYHCARQCMNGNYNNRMRLLKRSLARQENKVLVKKNVQELRKEGHREGDVKRFIKQFKRKEEKIMQKIDVDWATNVRRVELIEGDLRQISQCSLTDGCRLLQCIPEYDDHLEHNNAAIEIQRVSRGGRGRRRANDKKKEVRQGKGRSDELSALMLAMNCCVSLISPLPNPKSLF